MVDRVRTDGGLSVPVGNRVTSVKNSPSNSSTFNSARSGKYRRMNDVVIENYRRRVAQGEIFNNPMTKVWYEFDSTLSGYAHQHNNPSSLGTGQNYADSFSSLLNWKLGPLPYETSWTPHWSLLSSQERRECDAEASARAIRDYSSSQANGWVILGELQETLHLLKNPLSGITKLLIELYRLRGFKPHKLFKEMSSQYLKVIFGIFPLMSEVENVLKALEDPLLERSTFRGTKSLTRLSVRENLVLHQGSVLIDSRYTEVVQAWYKTRCGLLSEAMIPGLRQRMGLQFSMIPKAAWELLTLSFILDWVFNVKRYIEALTFSLANDARAQWIVTEDLTQVSRFVTATTVVPTWSVTKACTDTDRGLYAAKTRIPVNLGDLRTVTPKLPTELGKYVSALAIAAQRFF